jgi:hypothetical protein
MKEPLTKGEQLDVLYNGFMEMKRLAYKGIEETEGLIAEVRRLEESNEELLAFIEDNGLKFEKKLINLKKRENENNE